MTCVTRVQPEKNEQRFLLAAENYCDVTMTLYVTFVVDTFHTRKKFALAYCKKLMKVLDFEVEENDINIE